MILKEGAFRCSIDKRTYLQLGLRRCVGQILDQEGAAAALYPILGSCRARGSCCALKRIHVDAGFPQGPFGHRDHVCLPERHPHWQVCTYISKASISVLKSLQSSKAVQAHIHLLEEHQMSGRGT